MPHLMGPVSWYCRFTKYLWLLGDQPECNDKNTKHRPPIYFSATRLTRLADCQHFTRLDRLKHDEPMQQNPDEDHARLIQAKGDCPSGGFSSDLPRSAECRYIQGAL